MRTPRPSSRLNDWESSLSTDVILIVAADRRAESSHMVAILIERSNIPLIHLVVDRILECLVVVVHDFVYGLINKFIISLLGFVIGRYWNKAIRHIFVIYFR